MCPATQKNRLNICIQVLLYILDTLQTNLAYELFAYMRMPFILSSFEFARFVKNMVALFPVRYLF